MATKSKFLVKHGLAVNTQSGSSSTLNYPTADGTINQTIKTDGSGNLSFDSSVSSFINLTDTPVNYTSSANKTLIVDSTGSKIEFSDITAQNNVSRESFTASGDSNVITLANTYTGDNYVMVFIDGVIQFPGTNFSLDSTVLTFTATPDSAARIEVFGTSGNLITVPGDTTVSAAKLTNPLALQDNHKITFGNGNDLEIYHDGSNSYINETGTGSLIIKSDQDIAFDSSGAILFDKSDKALEFGDNYKAKFGAGGDLWVYHIPNENYIQSVNGNINILQGVTDGDVKFWGDNGSGLSTAVYILADGGTGEVVLSHYGNQKLATKNTGVTITGSMLADSATVSKMTVNGVITNDGLVVDGEIDIVKNANSGPNHFDFHGTTFNLRNYNGARYVPLLKAEDSAGVTLYHNDSSRLETTAAGVTISEALILNDSGTSFSMRGDSSGTGLAKFMLTDGTYIPYYHSAQAGQWTGTNRTIRIPNMDGEMVVKKQIAGYEYINLTGHATGFGGATDKSSLYIGAEGAGYSGSFGGTALTSIITKHHLRPSETADIEITAGTGSKSMIKLDADSCNVTGNLNVSGALTATTKSFDIVHPTKEGMRLRYGSLEGPENGIYVRGKLENSNIIKLPDYWTGLIDENTITVSLTPIGKYNEVWVDKIKDNKVHINSSYNNIQCFYHVFGERKDVDKLQVEYE